LLELHAEAGDLTVSVPANFSDYFLLTLAKNRLILNRQHAPRHG